ncbi:MAG: hypothetical protein K6C98_09935 [Treponema sp.]|nr:hypothetical protein [Treponema sp.]
MQSDLFMYAVATIKDSIQNKSKCNFEVVEEFSENKNQIKVAVTDIFQTTNDKTGQRIIVDEIMYEVPTQYEMHLSILFNGKKQEEVLSALGKVAVLFKDNNSFECGEYNWHGNDLNRFFLEPVIKKTAEQSNNYLHLDYKIELQLNSVKEGHFNRVEKKILNANQIK